jgi:hypothetical protein
VTGHPLALTINGKAELVVQDAEAYQVLLDRAEAIEGIQRGLADVKAAPHEASASGTLASSEAWHIALRLRRTPRPISKSCTCGSLRGRLIRVQVFQRSRARSPL